MTVWPNACMEDYAQALVDNLPELATLALYRTNVTVDPDTIFDDLDIDLDTEQAVTPAAWSLALVDDILIAQQPFDFSLSSGKAGETYYGVAFYDDSTSKKLGPVLTFPVPVIVPSGGVDFSQTVNLRFKDCNTPDPS